MCNNILHVSQYICAIRKPLNNNNRCNWLLSLSSASRSTCFAVAKSPFRLWKIPVPIKSQIVSSMSFKIGHTTSLTLIGSQKCLFISKWRSSACPSKVKAIDSFPSRIGLNRMKVAKPHRWKKITDSVAEGQSNLSASMQVPKRQSPASSTGVTPVTQSGASHRTELVGVSPEEP